MPPTWPNRNGSLRSGQQQFECKHNETLQWSVKSKIIKTWIKLSIEKINVSIAWRVVLEIVHCGTLHVKSWASTKTQMRQKTQWNFWKYWHHLEWPHRNMQKFLMSVAHGWSWSFDDSISPSRCCPAAIVASHGDPVTNQIAAENKRVDVNYKLEVVRPDVGNTLEMAKQINNENENCFVMLITLDSKWFSTAALHRVYRHTIQK